MARRWQTPTADRVDWPPPGVLTCVMGYGSLDVEQVTRHDARGGYDMGDLARVWNPHPEVQFDYDNQAWIVDGLYEDCSHPPQPACGCYGRIHRGEEAHSIH